MSEKTISDDKIKLLNSLLDLYKNEVEVIYAINISWDLLTDEAKSKCVEDFDQAIIARETLQEELAELRAEGIIPHKYEFTLFNVDQYLLELNSIVKDLYGLDARDYIHVKPPKGLLKAK